jgi:hypothetical protein
MAVPVLVGCAVSTAAIVWYIWVWFGVGELTGRLLAEIRVINCQSTKLTPEATNNHTRAVSQLKRTGDPFVEDIGDAF